MRVLLGALFLAAFFLAATLWQKRWTTAARTERNIALGSMNATQHDPGDGWSRVIVGRPSGSEPYRSPVRLGSPGPVPAPAGKATTEPGGSPIPHASESKPTLVIVQPGQSLSGICRDHYGTARVELVDAVAHHNRLSTPDMLREGQKLELPPLEALLPKR